MKSRYLAFLLLLIGSILASCSDSWAGLPTTAGPDLLRQQTTTAPQLTNAGIWSAPPILISGASAYRGGEFLYQDFIYDDHGANGTVTDPNQSNPNSVSEPKGTYTYPTGPGYDGNAADLVEFRVKPFSNATAFRVTLNTLADPKLVAFTIALGSSASPVAYPFGANVSGPAQLFLTVRNTTAVLANAATGKTITPAPTVQIDPTRHQYTVTVLHRAWNPGKSVVPIAMGVGLWNASANSYLVPATASSSTSPGGAGTLQKPAAFFNVAFRNEPLSGASSGTSNSWREAAQAASLANNDMTPFVAKVDFNKLSHKVDDESSVPATGAMDRILSSHFIPGVGVNLSISCDLGSNEPCTGQYLGQLQPYAVYIPPKKDTSPYGLTLLLHALGSNYNEYLGTNNQKQFALRGNGVIVITPEARGPDGFYYTYALADVFEVWADIASHYQLDPAWTTISGYSMGGYGTFFLSMEFPDLFARAMTIVGTGFNHNNREASLRNVPLLMWNAATDELVPLPEPESDATTLLGLGYRYELDVFAPAEHLTFALNDEYQPAADFLGTATVDSNPAHLSYIVDPLDVFNGSDKTQPNLDMAADHAYWLSAMKVRTPGSKFSTYDTLTDGKVEAISHGFGVGDPTASGLQAGSGTLQGGTIPVIAYTSQYQTWSAAPATPVTDQLDLNLTNVGALTIDVSRAKLDCNVKLKVTTDGPVAVTLAGCGKTVTF